MEKDPCMEHLGLQFQVGRMDRTGGAQPDYRATRSNKCAPVPGRESWAAGRCCFVALPCLPCRALVSTGQVQRRIPHCTALHCTAGVAANAISSVCTRDTWDLLGNNCVACLMSPARGSGWAHRGDRPLSTRRSRFSPEGDVGQRKKKKQADF